MPSVPESPLTQTSSLLSKEMLVLLPVSILTPSFPVNPVERVGIVVMELIDCIVTGESDVCEVPFGMVSERRIGFVLACPLFMNIVFIVDGVAAGSVIAFFEISKSPDTVVPTVGIEAIVSFIAMVLLLVPYMVKLGSAVRDDFAVPVFAFGAVGGSEAGGE